MPAAGRPKVDGTSVRVPVSCSGADNSSCSVRLTISTTAAGVGKDAVASSVPGAKKGPKTVVLGSGAARIAAGTTATVKISLNGLGKRLLARRGKLKAKLTLSEAGHTVGATPISFRVRHRSNPRR